MIVQSGTTMGSSVSHWGWSRCALHFTLVLGTVCVCLHVCWVIPFGTQTDKLHYYRTDNSVNVGTQFL